MRRKIQERRRVGLRGGAGWGRHHQAPPPPGSANLAPHGGAGAVAGAGPRRQARPYRPALEQHGAQAQEGQRGQGQHGKPPEPRRVKSLALQREVAPGQPRLRARQPALARPRAAGRGGGAPLRAGLQAGLGLRAGTSSEPGGWPELLWGPRQADPIA